VNKRLHRAGRRLVGTLVTAVLAALSTSLSAGEAFDESRLEKEVLIADARDAIQLQVSAEGDVYVIERAGTLRRYSVRDQVTRTLGKVPSEIIAEGGLIGLALAPDFTSSHQLYLLYSLTSKRPLMRLARSS